MQLWQPGQSLKNGKFIVEKVLGGGGFGITYRAVKPSTDTIFAIKTLNPMHQSQEDFSEKQEQFVNEALRLRGCQHPHIVKVHEVIQEGGLLGMVMEFIDGSDLGVYVNKYGQLTEKDALRYIKQVGEALECVHQQDLIHRDIKPSNIVVRSGTNDAVLIDFGLAREFTIGQTMNMTNSKTEGFAPIEQYERQGRFTAATDVYALAATLYCLLTGEVPIRANYRKDGGISLRAPKHFNSKISDGISDAVMRGMALEAIDRPQTVREWLELLTSIQSWKPGQTLQDGRFIVKNVLSGGGFGITYRAVEHRTGKIFAIKTLNPMHQSQDDFPEREGRFVNEAERLASYHHPHIVPVYEVIQETGLSGVVMEFIDGYDLGVYVAKLGKLAETDALRYIEQVGKALEYIHQQGFLHRDIKPSNIIVRHGTKNAVLIDFGLAREFTIGTSNSKTERFAPIEQYQRHGRFTTATDVYALAATLYFLLTAKVPISAHSRKNDNILLQPPKEFNSNISDRVSDAVIKGMALEASDRPQTVRKWLELVIPNPEPGGVKSPEADPPLWQIFLQVVGFLMILCISLMILLIGAKGLYGVGDSIVGKDGLWCTWVGMGCDNNGIVVWLGEQKGKERWFGNGVKRKWDDVVFALLLFGNLVNWLCKR